MGLSQEQARGAARRRLERLVGDLGTLKGVSVPLVRYPTENDYAVVGPGGGWEWADHEAVMAAAFNLLTASGAKPIFSWLRAENYLMWLQMEGKENTPATRAEYASLIVA